MTPDLELGSTFDLDRDGRSWRHGGAHALEQRAQEDPLRPGTLLVGLGACQHEQRLRDAREPIGLQLDVAEELVPVGGHVLGPGLKHLDRGDDRGQRRSELVGRVRRELSLGPLRPLPRRLVGHNENGRVVASGWDSGERQSGVGVRAEALLGGSAGPEQLAGELSERDAGPGLGKRRADGRVTAEQTVCRTVRVLGSKLSIDEEYPVVKAIEQTLELPALFLERLDEAAQSDPHRLDRTAETADLVGEPRTHAL